MAAKGIVLVGVAAVLAVAAVAAEGGGASRGGAVDRMIPADAQLVARVDVASLRRMWLEPLVGKGGAPGGHAGLWQQPELEAEVRAYLLGRLGLHVHDVTRVTAVVGPQGGWSVALLEGAFEGQPKVGAPKVTERGGLAVITVDEGALEAALVGDVLVVGHPAGLDAVAATHRGAAPSLASGAGGARLHAEAAAALGRVGGLTLTATLGDLPREAYGTFTGGAPLRAMAFAATPSGDLMAALVGDPQAAQAIAAQARAGLDLAVGTAESSKRQLAEDPDPFPGLFAILTTHQLRQLRDQLVIDHRGEVVSFRLEGVGAALPLIGILSASAIPAYLSYVEAARAAEERLQQLDRDREQRLHELEEDAHP